jgi:beta-galactosidase
MLHNQPLRVLFLTTLFFTALPSCSPIHPAPPPTTELHQQTLLDPDWRFHLGDLPNPPLSADYPDDQWRHLNLPHDYVIEGSYNTSSEKQHGYLPTSVAWYRKHLSIPASAQGKILSLDFDGAFRDSQVWLNGTFLGRHPSGYTPFSYDITHLAKPGSDNIIAVRIDPSQFEGHWYEGGGIYRHVYLTTLSPQHIARYGTFVTTTIPSISATGSLPASAPPLQSAPAKITLKTTLTNESPESSHLTLHSTLLDANNQIVATSDTPADLSPNQSTDLTQQFQLPSAHLWSLNSPYLYHLRTTLLHDGTPVDSTTTPFGIRTIHFDPNQGFFLNGQHVEIQGLANHQDLPAVGIAVPDSLQSWRVQQLKKLGCNAWRTAHNPPNPALLDACDQLGMLVMDENRHLGDAYSSHSPPGTTANDLSDLTSMIQRDRNHPSIIMWSLCNEEGLRGKSEGKRLFAAMTARVHQFDTTRPITCAINGSWIAKGITDEDIIGINYHFREYDAFHAGNPTVPLFGSEATNEKTTRGEYADNPSTGMRSAYNLSEDGWQAVITRPFIAGSFTWTGFDYKGEPNPYGWPDVSNHTGLLDSCGFPKDKAFYFQSCWSTKPMVHLLPSTWNPPADPSHPIRVIAFSNARQVELFLNGRSLGTKDMLPNSHVEWQVPYTPGTLTARASTDGKTVATDELQTTTSPTHIQLQTNRTTLRANSEDTVVITATLLDDHNRIVPDQDRPITFHLTGDAQLLGTGNGNPADHDPDKSNTRSTFHGHSLTLLQAGPHPSPLHLTATSPNLPPTTLTLISHNP